MATKKKMARTKGGDLGGFTIIEVVLVLAIAGLIFLMVFIALPALQRSQRDTQRRNDMAAMASQITQYQSNNNGKLPATTGGSNSVEAVDETSNEAQSMDYWKCSTTSGNKNSAMCFIRNYMNASGAAENTFKDPDGWMYGLTIQDFRDFKMPTGDFGDENGDNHYMIYLVEHAKCGDDESVEESKNARDYAIVYKLEGAGTYCNDNS